MDEEQSLSKETLIKTEAMVNITNLLFLFKIFLHIMFLLGAECLYRRVFHRSVKIIYIYQ